MASELLVSKIFVRALLLTRVIVVHWYGVFSFVQTLLLQLVLSLSIGYGGGYIVDVVFQA